ncbi:MAG: type II toxin-antitoxin system VapC family toxin [Phycisphaerae bacterium]
MPGIMVDSNVLLDILTEDSQWFQWSSEALAEAAERHTLVINAVIFVEVSVRFSRIEDVNEALPPEWFERRGIPYEAAFLAAKCFLSYRRRGGEKIVVLPDFFIGAHAAVEGLKLMTRDMGRYRTYFPRLDIISPAGR